MNNKNNVVEVTQNWSFRVQNWCLLEDQNLRLICGVRGPILAVFGSSLLCENQRPNEGIRGPILRDNFFQKRIFGADLFQFYGGYFYYKYRLCIRANFEIEGAETRV